MRIILKNIGAKAIEGITCTVLTHSGKSQSIKTLHRESDVLRALEVYQQEKGLTFKL